MDDTETRFSLLELDYRRPSPPPSILNKKTFILKIKIISPIDQVEGEYRIALDVDEENAFLRDLDDCPLEGTEYLSLNAKSHGYEYGSATPELRIQLVGE